MDSRRGKFNDTSLEIRVIAVGRGKDNPAQIIFNDYIARLPWKVNLIEIKEVGSGHAGDRRKREYKKIVSILPTEANIILIDQRGKELSSKKFAFVINEFRESRSRHLVFIIGGADGLDQALLSKSDLVLSLGEMTWPHILVRAMLAEQLWRAASILSGHPYNR